MYCCKYCDNIYYEPIGIVIDSNNNFYCFECLDELSNYIYNDLDDK